MEDGVIKKLNKTLLHKYFLYKNLYFLFNKVFSIDFSEFLQMFNLPEKGFKDRKSFKSSSEEL